MKKQKRRKTEIQQLRIDIKIMRAELESMKADIRRLATAPPIPYVCPCAFHTHYPKPPEIYCSTSGTQ